VNIMDDDLRATQIEARNVKLLMTRVEMREAKCQGRGRDAYHVWDEFHEHRLFAVRACGAVPKWCGI